MNRVKGGNINEKENDSTCTKQCNDSVACSLWG